MAWALFVREFNWSRPKSKFSFNVQPMPVPQARVHDVVDAAVEAGAARRIEPPDRDTAKAWKLQSRAYRP